MFSRIFSIGVSVFLIVLLTITVFCVWWFAGPSRVLGHSGLITMTIVVVMAMVWLIVEITKDLREINDA